MSEALREMYVGITFEDNASRDLRRLDDRVDDTGTGFNQLGDEASDAQRDIDRLGDEARSTERNIERLGDEANDTQRDMDRMGNQASGLGGTLKTLGGIIATVFAVDKIKDLGVSMVEAAASAKATEAQFSQVFAGIEADAEKGLNKIAEETQSLPNRLKGSFISMAAFAKTAGADAEQALAISERATLAAADGAAFYDKSIEEVSESLQSFLKGNFANDAALGISATEFTRNAAAAELFGKKYNELTELQKQETLLKMVEDGNKLSGALGQASREGDGFENVVGNLKQSWEDLKAKFGAPLLEVVVSEIQKLTAGLGKIDTDTLVEKFSNFIDKVKEGIQWGKDFAMTIKENWGPIKETIIGLGTAFIAFKTIMTGMSIISTINTLMVAYRAGTLAATLAQMGLNAAMLANPITWIVAGIAALIAIGVLLVRNWDTVKATAIKLWGTIKTVFAGIGSAIGTASTFIMEKMKGAWDFIKEAAANSLNSIIGGINKMIKTINKIPGIDIPLVANVKVNKIDGEKADGSHATGLASVPYNGYIGELHKGEAILTAKQSKALRSAGMLKEKTNGTPALNLGGSASTKNSNSAGNQFIFHITGSNPSEIAQQVREVISDMLDSELLTT